MESWGQAPIPKSRFYSVDLELHKGKTSHHMNWPASKSKGPVGNSLALGKVEANVSQSRCYQELLYSWAEGRQPPGPGLPSLLVLEILGLQDPQAPPDLPLGGLNQS